MRSDPIAELVRKQAEPRAALSQITHMRPGSLVQRYRRCGKPGRHCAQEGSRGHGPSRSLTREVAGKTVTKVVPAHAVELTRAQIAAYRRFRAIAKELLVEASERLCDARLAHGQAASKEASKRASPPRSSWRQIPSSAAGLSSGTWRPSRWLRAATPFASQGQPLPDV